MANKDLRDWIDGVKAAGELKVIKGAEPKEEIGGIVDIYMRKMGNPAVMFDEVPGYPKGHRVIANILTSIPRINIALGLPPETTEIEQIQWWRNYFKNAPIASDQGGERRAAARQRALGQGRQHRENPDAGVARAWTAGRSSAPPASW